MNVSWLLDKLSVILLIELVGMRTQVPDPGKMF
jgi:hypothetical protein